MTGVDINKKLDSFSNLIQEFAKGNLPIKEVINRKKEIAENFRAAQFENADDKITTTKRFDELVELIAASEKNLEAGYEVFTVEAEALVNDYIVKSSEVLQKEEISKEDFKDLRDLNNKTFEYFKQQCWTTKERRTTAWDKYSDVRNKVKDKEDELFAKERESRSLQLSQSLDITEKLCVVVDACHPNTPVEELQSFVNKFNDFLTSNNLQEQNKPWFLIEKPEEIKYSLRCRTETLNDVRNFINNYRDALTREHKGQIFANIDNLKEDLNKAWDQHKEDRQKQQVEWEEKQKERDEKRVEWHKKQQDFLVFLEKRLENQIAYKAKQEGYMLSQKEFAKRFENRIPAQQEYIKKLVEQTIDLEKKYATAWTDSFKTKVEEWIKEKKDKITAVEADIEVLKEKVIDINKNIDDLPKRVEELDASIVEIKEKIIEVKAKLENDVLPEQNNNNFVDSKIEATIVEEVIVEATTITINEDNKHHTSLDV